MSMKISQREREKHPLSENTWTNRRCVNFQNSLTIKSLDYDKKSNEID